MLHKALACIVDYYIMNTWEAIKPTIQQNTTTEAHHMDTSKVSLLQIIAICATLPPTVAARFLRDCTLAGV